MSKKILGRVGYDEAKRRALEYLDAHGVSHPSSVADAIWPGHTMKQQGAAFAAGAILRRMEKERLVYYSSIASNWGWVKR